MCPGFALAVNYLFHQWAIRSRIKTITILNIVEVVSEGTVWWSVRAGNVYFSSSRDAMQDGSIQIGFDSLCKLEIYIGPYDSPMLLDWQLDSSSETGLVNIKAAPPIKLATNTTVKIPAPALSAVVIGRSGAASCVCPVPAFGLLVPFPPVVVETGFEDGSRNFSITALII